MDHEQRLKELERCRRRGARLLAAGVAPAEVARGVAAAARARLERAATDRPGPPARREAIRIWKSRRWPELKKSPRDKAE